MFFRRFALVSQLRQKKSGWSCCTFSGLSIIYGCPIS
ncbi:hypothetical protein ZEAMMB73_Zm00001d036056 [Zea mays]|uniref:Uncharacterized protein n=1 Tax=Zea mays TaxID=4577 RepID=A0A1D6LKI5_MAIZE|nr:hypothetical protein ZEAMMB73_Zm00001d036056 [Zea mays]